MEQEKRLQLDFNPRLKKELRREREKERERRREREGERERCMEIE